MLEKAPDAFRTISEVAEELDLPQHVLRFWETRFPQIKPMKRGGGRRYYRPEDVSLITGLKTLLYGQGYTIKGVQRILKEQGAKVVLAIGRGEDHAIVSPVAALPAPAAKPNAGPQRAARLDDVLPHETLSAGSMRDAPPESRFEARSEPASREADRSHDAIRAALADLSAARAELVRALANDERD